MSKSFAAYTLRSRVKRVAVFVAGLRINAITFDAKSLQCFERG